MVLRALSVTLLVLAGAGCTESVGNARSTSNDAQPAAPSSARQEAITCTSKADCDALDGKVVSAVGVYRFHPDQPGVDYSGSPRAVRITLDDGSGPWLGPYWDEESIRPEAEVTKLLGKRVRVTGRYHRVQPRNPDDPPQASAMGGPCIHPIDAIELAE